MGVVGHGDRTPDTLVRIDLTPSYLYYYDGITSGKVSDWIKQHRFGSLPELGSRFATVTLSHRFILFQ